MKLHILGWLVFGIQTEISAVLRLQGTENKQLNITCTHSWATTNVKYFCRQLCGDGDVLVRSAGVLKRAQKGRYSLFDGGGRFTVGIDGLMKSDGGRYWCGVERVGMDTFEEVFINVLDAPLGPETPEVKPSLFTTLGNKTPTPRNGNLPISAKDGAKLGSHYQHVPPAGQPKIQDTMR
ncbi:CMRF35-like molecule 1 [Trichomycterus rosablanca]|uniref:CMRF35-like molecule 1 n=1 Tax=Trichomycterus rosablanca TaxID=2290929 RepID=UPI002F352C00